MVDRQAWRACLDGLLQRQPDGPRRHVVTGQGEADDFRAGLLPLAQDCEMVDSQVGSATRIYRLIEADDDRRQALALDVDRAEGSGYAADSTTLPG